MTLKSVKPPLSKKKFFISQTSKISLLIIFILALGFELVMINGTFFSSSLSKTIAINSQTNKNTYNILTKINLAPLGLQAALAAGSKTINFFWTPNDSLTKSYRLYHGIATSTYNESYDSQFNASSMEIDYSQFSLGKHYFALTAIGINGVESNKSAEIIIDLSKLNICGNGLVEHGVGEVCDGNTKPCEAAYGYRGAFACLRGGDNKCKGWSDECKPIDKCGDGVVNGTEVCDGVGTTYPCVSGLYIGTAICNNSSCQLNTCNVGSKACNNGTLEDNEQCEFNATTTCSWHGFKSTETCTDCAWGTCNVTPQCGLNVLKRFSDLSPQNSDNCKIGIVDKWELVEPIEWWHWTCQGSKISVDCLAYKKVDGICGSADGAISNGMPDASALCESGINPNPNYTAQHYEWACNGRNGGTSVNCQTLAGASCGNGISDDGEDCEGTTTQDCNWQGFPGTQTCGSCHWGACNVISKCGLNSFVVGGSILNTISEQDPGNCSVGDVTGYFSPQPGIWSWNCSAPSSVDPCIAVVKVNGVCGTAADGTYTSTSGPLPPTLCAVLNSSGLNYNSSTYRWDWTCNGKNRGVAVPCHTLAAAPCGNGTVDPGEFCDSGSSNGLYGFCNGDCTAIIKCGDGIKNDPDEQCDFGGNNSSITGCSETCTWDLVYHSCDPYNQASHVAWCGFLSTPLYGGYCKSSSNGSNGICASWYPVKTPHLPNNFYQICYPYDPCLYTCASDYGNCDYDQLNGCESDLNSDASHCGNCTTICGTGQACSSGECVFPPGTCGNNIVDTGEQCDGQGSLVSGLDLICTDDCKITKKDFCVNNINGYNLKNSFFTCAKYLSGGVGYYSVCRDISSSNGKSSCGYWDQPYPTYSPSVINSYCNDSPPFCTFKCKNGFENCADTTDGCETDLKNNSQHCGACITNCGNHGSCIDSACVCAGKYYTCASDSIECAHLDNNNSCGCSDINCGSDKICQNGGCVPPGSATN